MVSNRHRIAIRFVIDRMTAIPGKLGLNLNQNPNKRNEGVPSQVCTYSLLMFHVCRLQGLVVVLGKTRVKTEHDDDHGPQNNH